MEGLLSVILLFVVMVLVCRAKNNRDTAHPKKCDICGNTDSSTLALKDGCMCYKCADVKYMGRRIDLPIIMKKSRFKAVTVNEMKNYIATIEERGEMMRSFDPTRESEDGIIKVDDNLGLFILKDSNGNSFAHRPQDVESFKLVIDKNYTNPSDSILIDGGHIAIKLKEPVDEIIISYGSKRDSFGAKHEVRKALEPDLEFLEKLTGLKRK